MNMKWSIKRLLDFKCWKLKNAKASTLIIIRRSYTQHDSKALTHVRICQRLLLVAQHISQLTKIHELQQKQQK